MAAPKVYKSTDANAPVLNGTAGSLVNVIRAVAVEGYGEKAPLEWAEAYGGTSKAVFRPDSGRTLHMYRFDDANAQVCEVKAYESMADVDSGSGLWQTGWIGKSQSANTSAVPWIIIGDSAIMLLFIKATSLGTDTYTMYIIGDSIPMDSNDYSAQIAFLSAANTFGGYGLDTFCGVIDNLTTVRAGLKIYRNGAGSLGQDATLITNGSGHRSGIAMGQDGKKYTGILRYARPTIASGDTWKDAYDRAYVPGLYYPNHSIWDHGLAFDGSTYTDDGRILLPIKIQTSIGSIRTTVFPGGADVWAFLGIALVDIGEGFRP